MTGFDETVPPDPSQDAASPQDARDNVVAPEGGPAQTDADTEDAPPMAGDPDIQAGHRDE